MLFVWGDWYTVIGSGEKYRDCLLNQSPVDEQESEFREYRIPCETTADLMDAYGVFRIKLNLSCHVGFRFETSDHSFRVFVLSGNGYDKQGPYCDAECRIPTSDIEAAATQAVEILKKALK